MKTGFAFPHHWDSTFGTRPCCCVYYNCFNAINGRYISLSCAYRPVIADSWIPSFGNWNVCRTIGAGKIKLVSCWICHFLIPCFRISREIISEIYSTSIKTKARSPCRWEKVSYFCKVFIRFPETLVASGGEATKLKIISQGSGDERTRSADNSRSAFTSC